jgi:hypothetical protein
MHGALGKGEDSGFAGFFFGERAAPFLAGGYAAGVFSVLLAVDPLEEGIKQEITYKDAKREIHIELHETSLELVRMPSPYNEIVGAENQKSPEKFVKNLLRGGAGIPSWEGGLGMGQYPA